MQIADVNDTKTYNDVWGHWQKQVSREGKQLHPTVLCGM